MDGIWLNGMTFSRIQSIHYAFSAKFLYGRPIMSARAQATICTDLGSHVEILYPSPEYESKVIPSTEEVADLAVRVTFSSDRVSKQAEAEALQQEVTKRAITKGEA